MDEVYAVAVWSIWVYLPKYIGEIQLWTDVHAYGQDNSRQSWNVRVFLETSGYEGGDEAESDESSCSGRDRDGRGVHMTESEQYVPVTNEIITKQEMTLHRWMDSMTGYLTDVVNSKVVV